MQTAKQFVVLRTHTLRLVLNPAKWKPTHASPLSSKLVSTKPQRLAEGTEETLCSPQNASQVLCACDYIFLAALIGFKDPRRQKNKQKTTVSLAHTVSSSCVELDLLQSAAIYTEPNQNCPCFVHVTMLSYHTISLCLRYFLSPCTCWWGDEDHGTELRGLLVVFCTTGKQK